jgi:hypothetical protein
MQIRNYQAQQTVMHRQLPRVATKWVSGYFAKYEIGRNKTFFSRNFGGIPRNSAEGFCQNFAYFREILLLISRNFAEFRGINYNFAILVTGEVCHTGIGI